MKGYFSVCPNKLRLKNKFSPEIDLNLKVRVLSEFNLRKFECRNENYYDEEKLHSSGA